MDTQLHPLYYGYNRCLLSLANNESEFLRSLKHKNDDVHWVYNVLSVMATPMVIVSRSDQFDPTGTGGGMSFTISGKKLTLVNEGEYSPDDHNSVKTGIEHWLNGDLTRLPRLKND